MGFGHASIRTTTRARRLSTNRDQVFEVTGRNPLLDIALELNESRYRTIISSSAALSNVDFYSGLIYQSMGLPMDMFPVLFAIPRTSGWIAQWDEMLTDSDQNWPAPSSFISAPRRATTCRWSGANKRARFSARRRAALRPRSSVAARLSAEPYQTVDLHHGADVLPYRRAMEIMFRRALLMGDQLVCVLLFGCFDNCGFL